MDGYGLLILLVAAAGAFRLGMDFERSRWVKRFGNVAECPTPERERLALLPHCPPGFDTVSYAIEASTAERIRSDPEKVRQLGRAIFSIARQ